MKNLFNYEGKRVIVTGASSGMGEATAKLVHDLGAKVIAVDIQPPKYDFAEFIQGDLRKAEVIEGIVSKAAAGGPINNLFYCAGLPGGKFPKVDVLLVNFIGLRHMSMLCAKHMKQGDAIATVSSAAGMGYLGSMANIMPLIATTDHAQAKAWVEANQNQEWFEPYSFSKMCTIVFTLRTAATLTKETGVRINCISPGPTDTGMMPAFIETSGADFMAAYPRPIGRNSTSEEQAWPLAFLNSPAASYISGENLFTDGGTAGGLMTGAIDRSLLMRNK